MHPAAGAGRTGVIFDVDGTLVDSNYLHTVAWARAFKEFGIDVEMYRIHRSIGMGSDQLLEHLVGSDDPRLSEAHSKQMKQFHEDQVAFPGAADLLRQVHRRGAVVAWATSAKADEVEHLLDLVGARDAIDHVTNSKDVESTKPSPDIFKVTLEACGLDPKRSLAVGDTKWDVEAASRSGIPCIGLLTGGTSAPELKEAGAVAVYVDVADLLGQLDDSPIAELLKR